MAVSGFDVPDRSELKATVFMSKLGAVGNDAEPAR